MSTPDQHERSDWAGTVGLIAVCILVGWMTWVFFAPLPCR